MTINKDEASYGIKGANLFSLVKIRTWLTSLTASNKMV